MKIRYMSDLHLEFKGYLPNRLPSVGEDVVVLGGDIGIGTRGIEWATEAFPDRPVLYVLGNHEFYRHDFNTLVDRARAAAAGTNVHFLENDRIDLGGVRFLGATLWTGFDFVDAASRAETIRACELAMNDFRLITRGKRYLDVVDTIERHQTSRAWLEDEIRQSPLPVVVVTHHSPSLANQHPDYLGEILGAAFHSNAEDLFRAPVRLWISGHNHHSCEVQVNGIDLVSNQRGYPREAIRFDWDQCITLDGEGPCDDEAERRYQKHDPSLQVGAEPSSSTEERVARDSGGLRVAIGILKKLGTTEAQRSVLLGVSQETYLSWEGQVAVGSHLTEPLSDDVVARLSYILGIWKAAMEMLSTEESAIAAIVSKNTADTFFGGSPLDRMLQGRVTDLAAVRQWFDGWVTKAY